MKNKKLKQEGVSKKKILFVINTMGQAGAETALLELLKKLENCDLEIFLYVLMGQGELISRIPSHVRLLNAGISTESVLSASGRRRLAVTVLLAFMRSDRKLRNLLDVARGFASRLGKGKLQPDKLLWRVVSDGAERFDIFFDLAVAWLEGGSAYYVSDHVNAGKKIAFIHIDYKKAGYTKRMDRDCWKQMDRIFVVSENVRESFLEFYPECETKLRVFQNAVSRESIRRRAAEDGGFSDGFRGIRLLTVGRLDHQKGYDIAVEAMSILKNAGYPVRWYVLGEGPERRRLERRIAALGLSGDFLLPGAMKNPYPYYAQADIYVHATRFEGKSIAIQEAQALGCPVIASDCDGNRELISDGRDGILCELTPEGIAGGIADLIEDIGKRKELGRMAWEKRTTQGQELEMLLEMLAERA